MKSIATLSDQYIGLQFRKDNGLPIDPTSIHFKGKVYTNPNTPFEFEINKGVLTNCVIKYNLVILHIVPNFKSGTVSIEGNRVNPKIVMSNSFSFDVAKNDRVAVFMKSDKNDGFYIESTTDGKPFYWSTLVFDEEKEIPKNIVDLIEQNGIQFTKAGKPVDNPDKYSISIDVDTNKITVITK